jgi:SAM-dependent methyltransferase
VGPGTGYYSLRVAEWLRPGGTLYVLDVQQRMLDHLKRRAEERSVENIVPTRADARALPYSDDTFDAAYLTLWSLNRRLQSRKRARSRTVREKEKSAMRVLKLSISLRV